MPVDGVVQSPKRRTFLKIAASIPGMLSAQVIQQSRKFLL